jgi:hypothetical protein
MVCRGGSTSLGEEYSAIGLTSGNNNGSESRTVSYPRLAECELPHAPSDNCRVMTLCRGAEGRVRWRSLVGFLRRE